MAFFLLLAAAVGCTSPLTKKSGGSGSPDPDAPNPNDSEFVSEDEESETPESPARRGTPEATAGGTKLSWNAVPGYTFAIGILDADGTSTPECIQIHAATSTTFDGKCSSAPDKARKPAAFQLWFSDTGSFADYVEQPAGAAEITFEVPTTPPSSLPISWTQKSPTAEYSLDVVLKNGQVIAPCIDAGVLRRNLSYTYEGRCTDGSSIAIGSIRELRLWSTEGGDWSRAVSKSRSYSGLAKSVKITL